MLYCVAKISLGQSNDYVTEERTHLKNHRDITKLDLSKSMKKHLGVNALKELFAHLIEFKKFKKLDDFILENYTSRSKIIEELLNFIERNDNGSFDTLILTLQKLFQEKEGAIWNEVVVVSNFDQLKKLYPQVAEDLNKFFAGID